MGRLLHYQSMKGEEMKKRKTKQRALPLALAVVLLLSLFALGASAEECTHDWTYTDNTIHLHTKTCSLCGASQQEAHSLTFYDFVEVGSTYYASYYCSLCDSYKNRPYCESESCEYGTGTIVLEATCTTDGVLCYSCVNCYGSYKYETIPALGHTMSDSVCTVCGYTEPVTETETETEVVTTIPKCTCSPDRLIGVSGATHVSDYENGLYIVTMADGHQHFAKVLEVTGGTYREVAGSGFQSRTYQGDATYLNTYKEGGTILYKFYAPYDRDPRIKMDVGDMLNPITTGIGGILTGVGSTIVSFVDATVLDDNGNLTTFAVWALAFLGIAFGLGVVKFITFLVKKK